MAEITIQRTGEFLRKLFETILSHPEGMQAKNTDKEAQDLFPLKSIYFLSSE
jgi:hypothetical protein